MNSAAAAVVVSEQNPELRRHRVNSMSLGRRPAREVS
jgi:hypothetical protein